MQTYLRLTERNIQNEPQDCKVSYFQEANDYWEAFVSFGHAMMGGYGSTQEEALESLIEMCEDEFEVTEMVSQDGGETFIMRLIEND